MTEPCLCGDPLCQNCFPGATEHHELCREIAYSGEEGPCDCAALRKDDKAEEADFMNDLWREDGLGG